LSLDNIGSPEAVVKSPQRRLAFEGALGYGRYTIGGRGGRVYEVTTLEDNDQPGSLRHALNQPEPRIVRFKVSGIIMLQKPLTISKGHLTVEGQTSPVGIVVAGAPVKVSADQVILRYLRFRPGSFGYVGDGLEARGTRDVIIDHCSMSWSVDEAGSFYNNTNFTLQNSIVSNSLSDSSHPKGKHGYGGIWGGNNASFVRNIIGNHTSRTPRINGHRLESPYPEEAEFVEVVNNVIYNWGRNNVYGAEDGALDLLNNFYLPGHDSECVHFLDIFLPLSSAPDIFISGNLYHGKPEWNEDNIAGVVARNAQEEPEPIDPSDSRLSSSPRGGTLPTLEARENFRRIIGGRRAGANKNAAGFFLDSVDRQLYDQIEQTMAGQPPAGILNHETDQITSWQAYAREFASPIQPSD